METVDALVDLWVSLAAGQREHGSHLLAEENRARIRESIVRHVVADRLLVAREEALHGFVMFTVENGSYEQDVTRGIVENLFVVPASRDDGVGSTLLDAAETHLGAEGVDAIALEVMTDNEDARRFYLAHGYDSHRVEFEKELDE